MKIRTADAARALGIHPVSLLLYLGEVGPASFEEFWPELEETWLEAIRSAYWDRFGAQCHGGALEAPSGSPPHPPTEHPLSENASHILEKLWRKKKWSGVRVTFEALINMVHLPSSALEAALEELETHHLVIRHADQYSLDPSRTAEIERIARALTRGD